MVELDIDGITELIEIAKKLNVNLTEEELVKFVLTFQKIIQVLVLNNGEYQLRLTKEHKLSAEIKRYHNKDNLIVSMKKARN